MNDDSNFGFPPFNNTGKSDDSRKRVELKVLGISYSQIQSGAYALILAEADGPMRLPVVVGGMEAQSIAIKLEGITPPRPMTHDLFCTLMDSYDIQLIDVFIYKFEDGIFSSELTFINNKGQEARIDARTSDAIAIAMRKDIPIYTTRKILNDTGFAMESMTPETTDDIPEVESTRHSEKSHLEKLKAALAKAIEEEAYEEASRLQQEINAIENPDTPTDN
jgi:bifunctional DNase/RNase